MKILKIHSEKTFWDVNVELEHPLIKSFEKKNLSFILQLHTHQFGLLGKKCKTLRITYLKLNSNGYLQSPSDIIVSNFLVDRSYQVCRRPLIALVSARKTLSILR